MVNVEFSAKIKSRVDWQPAKYHFSEYEPAGGMVGFPKRKNPPKCVYTRSEVVWENYEVVILFEDEAKNAGIALAMASIFNEVFRQKHPSEILKLFRFGYNHEIYKVPECR